MNGGGKWGGRVAARLEDGDRELFDGNRISVLQDGKVLGTFCVGCKTV